MILHRQNWKVLIIIFWENAKQKKVYLRNFFHKTFVSSGSMSGVDKIPTVDEYENAMEGDLDLNKMTIKLGELNELAYEDLI